MNSSIIQKKGTASIEYTVIAVAILIPLFWFLGKEKFEEKSVIYEIAQSLETKMKITSFILNLP